jgi:hypothetical protein
VGHASDKDLIWALKTGAIKNCEVKPKDLENAIAIWGKNVAELRGKTVWKMPAPVVSDIMKVPRDLLKLEKDVSLALTFLRQQDSLSHHVEFEDLFQDSFEPEEPENEDCGCCAQAHLSTISSKVFGSQRF